MLVDFKIVRDKISKDNQSKSKAYTLALLKSRQDFFLKLSWHINDSSALSVVNPGGPGLSQVVPWMLQIDKSHCLYVAGVLVFCDKCCSILSQPRKSRLHEPCVPLPMFSDSNSKQLHGSRGRTTSLKAGSLTGTHLKRWPIGLPKHTRVYPKRIWFVPKEPTETSVGMFASPSTRPSLGPIGQGLPFAALANSTSESASFIADLLGPHSFFHTTREDEEEAASIKQGVDYH